MRGMSRNAQRSKRATPLVAVFAENPWLRRAIVAVLERHDLSVESIIDVGHVTRLRSGPTAVSLRAAVVAHAWDATSGQEIVAGLRGVRADIGIVCIDAPSRSESQELHLATPFGPVALLDAVRVLLGEDAEQDSARDRSTAEAEP
jgi:hypothetical protein